MKPQITATRLPLILRIAAALLVIIAGAYWFFDSEAPEPSPHSGPAVESFTSPILSSESDERPNEETPPIELPLLDVSDSFVRDLATTMSDNQGFMSWLNTDRLIRTFVVVVDNVAEGSNPAQHILFIRPNVRFNTQTSEDGLQVAPDNFHRYDAMANIVASLSPQATSMLYRQLLPLLDEAYLELGYPGMGFSETLHRAIARILDTPIITGEPNLVPAASFFAYTDERLQSLPQVQRQLLLMGPDNLQMIQDSVRNIATALGFDRLPPSRVIVAH